MNRVLVGTAGHIDHGKSALVKALTGTDPDRLPEEKARGITIDLGFAHAAWGDTIFSFVDVPGHEKFVKTMVAGAQGIDLVLLAVASDDSVMPQTREHLAIVKLLGVATGVIARTKSDLVDAETGALVDEEIRDLVKGSFLEGAPVVAVSSVTGEGIEALKEALARAASKVSHAGRERRVTRIGLDRAFTMKGFGPVVTGTLDGGTIEVDGRLTLFPEGKDVRVRRVEVHGEVRREALAGERTSLNLAGVERSELRRGQTLAATAALVPSSVLTVEYSLLPEIGAPIADATKLRVHHGTADVGGRLARLPLEGETGKELRPGETAFGQLLLEAPLPALPGDGFILRRPSPVETVGGGRVLDVGRPRIRRLTEEARRELTRVLEVLRRGDEAELASLFLREAGAAGLTAQRLGQRLGVPRALAAQRLEALAASGEALRIAPDLHVHAAAADVVRRRAGALLSERRKSGAALLSFSRGEFLERLGKGLPPGTAEAWLSILTAAKTVALEGDRVSEPGARAVTLSEDATGFAARIAEAYRAAAFEPPKGSDLARLVGTKPPVVDGLVSHLLKSGVLVRVSPDLVVHRDVVAAAEKKLETVRGQTLPISAFRDLFALTRKNLIPLLEYFDGRKKTRRVGDARRVE